MPRGRGGNRGAGFVGTLPAKPANFDKALASLRAKHEPAHRVGWGFDMAPKDQQPADPPPRDPKAPKPDPNLPVVPLPKRVGAWTFYVYAADPAFSCAPVHEGIPVTVRYHHAAH